ncbi:tRNA pseudouridine synthase B [Bienertia sinuspersici]
MSSASKTPHPKPLGASSRGVVKVNKMWSLRRWDGWVSRQCVECSGEATRACWPPGNCKGEDFVVGCKLAQKHGYKDVLLESDCETIVLRLSKSLFSQLELDLVLKDVLFQSSVLSISFLHVKRGGNFIAHHLAKLVPLGIEQVWTNLCPKEVEPYVLSDALSLINELTRFPPKK